MFETGYLFSKLLLSFTELNNFSNPLTAFICFSVKPCVFSLITLSIIFVVKACTISCTKTSEKNPFVKVEGLINISPLEGSKSPPKFSGTLFVENLTLISNFSTISYNRFHIIFETPFKGNFSISSAGLYSVSSFKLFSDKIFF